MLSGSNGPRTPNAIYQRYTGLIDCCELLVPMPPVRQYAQPAVVPDVPSAHPTHPQGERILSQNHERADLFGARVSLKSHPNVTE